MVAPFMRGYPPTEASPKGDYSALTLGKDAGADRGVRRASGGRHRSRLGRVRRIRGGEPPAGPIRRLVAATPIPHPGALKFNLRTLRKARHFRTFRYGGRTIKVFFSCDNFAGIEIYRRWSPNWNVSAADLAPSSVRWERRAV
ncbi:MAG: hypothetical protein U0703_01040 [Anaerolineae bacterium]